MNRLANNEKKEPLFKYVKDYYWTIFRNNTATLSSTCRQLALGIGGLAWLAKSNPYYQPFKSYTDTILLFLVAFFLLDALQYLNQSIRFLYLAKNYDAKIDNGKITRLSELSEPPGINLLTIILFALKLLILVVASLVFMCLIWEA